MAGIATAEETASWLSCRTVIPVDFRLPRTSFPPYYPALDGFAKAGPSTMVDGVVAQLVERLVRNEKVRSSSLLGSTISPLQLVCFPQTQRTLSFPASVSESVSIWIPASRIA
jgi:hypothetical protein